VHIDNEHLAGLYNSAWRALRPTINRLEESAAEVTGR
jgi:hypothetical protein